MSGSGRNVSALYRKNRAILLAADDQCWLCLHPGAKTADHVIPAKDWPRDSAGQLLPGLDGLENLRPAHGTMGSRAINPCMHPSCAGRLCNQSRGTRSIVSPRSRAW